MIDAVMIEMRNLPEELRPMMMPRRCRRKGRRPAGSRRHFRFSSPRMREKKEEEEPGASSNPGLAKINLQVLFFVLLVLP